MTDSWSEDDRLSRLVNVGRQLVDGVSGARPGSRSAGRGRAAGVPRLDQLGRWVEDKLDRILDDEEDWREPWQEAAPQKPSRRPLEAISRRRSRAFAPAPDPAPVPRPAPEAGPDVADEWPEDGAFAVPRWQRPPSPTGGLGGARPLPRSTRRR